MSGTSESIASWQWKRVEPFFVGGSGPAESCSLYLVYSLVLVVFPEECIKNAPLLASQKKEKEMLLFCKDYRPRIKSDQLAADNSQPASQSVGL